MRRSDPNRRLVGGRTLQRKQSVPTFEGWWQSAIAWCAFPSALQVIRTERACGRGMGKSVKVLVDRAKCQSYGNCVVAEPRVFDLDDEGYVKVLVEDPSDELREQVRYAVQDCPARALDLED
ncbi:hypothetical protein GCM10010306_060830 [Streptomyces umbrinus]|nr:hypothetical protein GCM10010306_060830 [Streptomyces umbrinus]